MKTKIIFFLFILLLGVLWFFWPENSLSRLQSAMQSATDPVQKEKLMAEREEKFAHQRALLVEQSVCELASDSAVLKAMKKVPRHQFTRPEDIEKAYRDHPLPIGYGQTISQPSLVAYMTELLALKPNDRVLEIGTGSGYQAAILAELVQEVYTIELVSELEKTAKQRLSSFYGDRVQVKCADGYYGWSEYAPFSAIIVTAALDHIPSPLIQQMKEGGKMVIPVGPVYQTQELILVTKKEGGVIQTKSVLSVSFVPFVHKEKK